MTTLREIIKNWIEKEYGQNLFDCEALAEHLLTFKQYCNGCQFNLNESCRDCYGNWEEIIIKPGFTPKEGK